MKNIRLLLLMSFALISCSNDPKPELNTNEIIGKWKLVEQLLDPGDGSGVFTEVVSEKTIQFIEDGSFVSNGIVCSIDIGSSQESSGTYSIQTNELFTEACSEDGFVMGYQLKDSAFILSLPCIEACSQKFVKIED